MAINSEDKFHQVLEQHRDRLMAMGGVVGVGEGIYNGKPCIKVFVIKKSIEIVQDIPAYLEGYAVSIEETEEFKAL
jgi:hypothetical protein